MVFYLSSQWQNQLEWCCSDGWICPDQSIWWVSTDESIWLVDVIFFFPSAALLNTLIHKYFFLFFSMSKTLEPLSESIHFKDSDSVGTTSYSLHMASLLWLPGNAFVHEITLCAGFIFEMYAFIGHFFHIFKLQIIRTIKKEENHVV